MVNFLSEMHLRTVSLPLPLSLLRQRFKAAIYNLEVKAVVTESTEEASCCLLRRYTRLKRCLHLFARNFNFCPSSAKFAKETFEKLKTPDRK